MDAVNRILSDVVVFSLEVVVGTLAIVAERDEVNGATNKIPPVLPVDLCSATSRSFTASLQEQRCQLWQKLSVKEIEGLMTSSGSFGWVTMNRAT